MKKNITYLLSILITFTSLAQEVLVIDEEKISLEEFQSVFFKNNNDTVLSKDFLDEYMDLFVNFKLKVKNAKDLGYDTLSSFVTEFSGYKSQLSKPYLQNREFDEKMLIEAYDRMKFDINASHILIKVDENSSEKESKLAYDKILAIRSDIIEEKITFSEAAKKNSDDKSAEVNGGNLNYFTAFMMVYDFETIAYSTNVGEISLPVRTKYGYHIIKVNDKRNAVGNVKVAHIMFKSGIGSAEKKINDAKEKISKISELISNGEEFADLAERFSEDRSTAVKGGALPPFGVGKMVPEFEASAFALKEIGDVSKPFKTAYGWHIIKLLEKEEVPSFDEIKSELMKKIQKDSRGELSKKSLFAKLRKSYKIVNNSNTYRSFRKVSANQVKKRKFTIEKVDNRVLLTINKKIITVSKFADFIILNQKRNNDIDELFINFVDNELLLCEENNLEEKYPEYKSLLKEYRDGILLFDLTNVKVWSKAIEDTVGLKNFYTLNKSAYFWEERLDATIYNCIDLETAKYVKRSIYKIKRNSMTDAELLKKANSKSALSLKINSKKFIKGENSHIDNIVWKLGVSSDIKTNEGNFVIINVKEILPITEKKFNETKGKVISDYQKLLEKEWLEELHSIYNVSINKKVLYSLIK